MLLWHYIIEKIVGQLGVASQRPPLYSFNVIIVSNLERIQKICVWVFCFFSCFFFSKLHSSKFHVHYQRFYKSLTSIVSKYLPTHCRDKSEFLRPPWHFCGTALPWNLKYCKQWICYFYWIHPCTSHGSNEYPICGYFKRISFNDLVLLNHNWPSGWSWLFYFISLN